MNAEETAELDAEADKIRENAGKKMSSYEAEKKKLAAMTDSEYRNHMMSLLPKDIDSEARAVYMRAVEAEKEITGALKEINQEIGGAELEDLEFRLKAGDSFAEKIEREKEDYLEDNRVPPSDGKLASKLYDLNRYTQVSESGKMVDAVRETLDKMKSRGYTVNGVRNYWIYPNSSYKGINVKLKSPNGQQFEIQFHTPETLKLKTENHLDYEVSRNIATSKAVKEYAARRIKQRIYGLKIPDRIWEVE